MTYYNGQNEPDIIEEIENKILKGWFDDKEELFNFLIELRTNGETKLDSKKIRELLILHDNSINNVQTEKTQGNGLVKTLRNPSAVNTTPDPNKKAASIGRAAFTKIGLLVINIITFALLVFMIILLNK